MPITLAANAMGTRFELVLLDDDTHRLRSVGELALREITDCHQRFNLFDPGSWLNSINRRAGDEAVGLDDLTFQLLDICQQVHRDSDGAFDITVAPLMYATGLHNPSGPGDAAQLEKARTCIGMHHMHLDPDAKTIRFAKPGMSLDLGAVAKGFAIDLAIELLQEHGVTCALLHGGTSTAGAIGSPPDQEAWRVKVRAHNATQSNESAITVHLNDSALSVSAPVGRVIESHGKTIGHIMDPRTTAPASCGAFAAAVGRSACLADAWSTALLVLGNRPAAMPKDMQAILPGQTVAEPVVSTTNQSTQTKPRGHTRVTTMEGVST